VTEQGGRARTIVDGVVESTPLATLRVDAQGEHGLVGVAVHPDFARNSFVYFYHTVPAAAGPPAAAHNRITRFLVRGNEVDPASATTILVLDDLGSRTNHNGGGLVFGRDGKLYVAVGDARTRANAQSLATRHGKLLRVEDNGSIPGDNPQQFAGIIGTPQGANRAIWAAGLRNPFRLAVQPHTGWIFVNDVGENRHEEINEGRPGGNYGWPSSEGPTTLPNIVQSVYHYAHSSDSPTGCAITGGTFYDVNSGGFPDEFENKYLFGDYCGVWIYYIDPVSSAPASPFHSGLNAPVDLAFGPDGALYYAQAGNGQVRRIRYNGASAQRILASANKLDIGEGESSEIAVRLASPPSADMTVSAKLTFADPTIQLSPATLTFGPAN
jgi:glucose/arabinose dehydrogenase